MDELKNCIKCKTSKPATIEFFYYRNKARGWFSSWCKLCHLQYDRDNKDSINKKQQERRARKPKLCNLCKINPHGYEQRYCNACRTFLKRKQKKRDKAVRKRRFRQATPLWADKKAIKDFYDNRPADMQVDHIIPLRGKNISGLHIIYNLQYLPARDNLLKSNKFTNT